MTRAEPGTEQVVLGQIGEHVEPQACRGCGKSASACGRSRNFCCPDCSSTRFGTHYAVGGDAA